MGNPGGAIETEMPTCAEATDERKGVDRKNIEIAKNSKRTTRK